MYHNYDFDDVNDALPRLLLDLEKKGDEVGSRAGRTKELTHVGITLRKSWRREIRLAHRKPNLAAQIAESAWVLGGKDDIGWLGHYLPRAKDFSDDGLTWRAGYGRRLRSWNRRDDSADIIDQWRWAVDHLRSNRASRQAVMSIWDPVVDTTPGKDIPCNDWLNFSSRLGRLDLHVALRSNDAIWGWSGINQFEWSSLLEVTAGLLGLEVGSLHFSVTSFHIYDHHWNKSNKITEAAFLGLPPGPVAESPRFNSSALKTWDVDGFDNMLGNWFEIEKGIRAGENMDDLVNAFPEPMFQSWLRVLQWWWTGDRDYLAPLEGTALEQASFHSVQPPDREFVELLADDTVVARRLVGSTPVPSDFIQFAVQTHNEKHAAYGDSWKRRGEMLGIMANIARKVDRLGGSDTADETSADTAMDLMVYLAKYASWLTERLPGYGHSDTPDEANDILLSMDANGSFPHDLSDAALRKREVDLKNLFDRLEKDVVDQRPDRVGLVEAMLINAYVLARSLWNRSQDEYKGADHE